MEPTSTRSFARRFAVLFAVIGAGILVATNIIGWSLAFQRGAEVDNLTATARRQSPVSVYNAAAFEQLECVKAYEVQFFAHITDALGAGRDPDLVATAQKEINVDRTALNDLTTKLCPRPSPPVFDNDGKLVASPQVYPQTFPPGL